MPKKASTTWSGGSIKLDTADKKELIAHPQQQHNLSLAPNRNVLLTAPPNKGKSSLCLQILGRSAPFHAVFVLHGTPGTKEFDIIDHKKLTERQKLVTQRQWKVSVPSELLLKRGKGKTTIVTLWWNGESVSGGESCSGNACIALPRCESSTLSHTGLPSVSTPTKKSS